MKLQRSANNEIRRCLWSSLGIYNRLRTRCTVTTAEQRQEMDDGARNYGCSQHCLVLEQVPPASGARPRLRCFTTLPKYTVDIARYMNLHITHDDQSQSSYCDAWFNRYRYHGDNHYSLVTEQQLTICAYASSAAAQ